MKFSICKIEYEGQWGGDSEDKEFTTLEELVGFIKQATAGDDWVYRFIIYDKLDNAGRVGYITFCGGGDDE